ncbi:hypothetical protein FACS189449_02250 [Alphaproteobacteria bacterium]|nr:hypothetical protein FACS189449_02250 [Alphaproteobacteria bacterium]
MKLNKLSVACAVAVTVANLEIADVCWAMESKLKEFATRYHRGEEALEEIVYLCDHYHTEFCATIHAKPEVITQDLVDLVAAACKYAKRTADQNTAVGALGDLVETKPELVTNDLIADLEKVLTSSGTNGYWKIADVLSIIVTKNPTWASDSRVETMVGKLVPELQSRGAGLYAASGSKLLSAVAQAKKSSGK